MLRKKLKKFSRILNRDMEICVFGHYGFALMLFPANSDSCTEGEENGVIDALAKYIKKGKMRVFSISTLNSQSWFNNSISNEAKSKSHLEFNNYLADELIPQIFKESDGPTPVITCGAGVGAYHAANTYFRRPDLFYGSIALSGTFNIEHYTNGYFDSNCYFNSPIHYLPNLNDPYWLSFLQSKHHVYLFSGSGAFEYPLNTELLSQILKSKKIPHYTEIWGQEFNHSYDTWKEMLKHIFDTKL